VNRGDTSSDNLIFPGARPQKAHYLPIVPRNAPHVIAPKSTVGSLGPNPTGGTKFRLGNYFFTTIGSVPLRKNEKDTKRRPNCLKICRIHTHVIPGSPAKNQVKIPSVARRAGVIPPRKIAQQQKAHYLPIFPQDVPILLLLNSIGDF